MAEKDTQFGYVRIRGGAALTTKTYKDPREVVYDADNERWAATEVGGKTIADLRPCDCATIFDMGPVDIPDRVYDAFASTRCDGPGDKTMHEGCFLCGYLLDCDDERDDIPPEVQDEDDDVEQDPWVWTDSDGTRYHCFVFVHRTETCQCAEGPSSRIKRGEKAIYKYGVDIE